MNENDWKTGSITLSVNGVPLKLELTVPAIPVKPQVMLPLFQQLANAFTDMATKMVEQDQLEISCRKGCGACCRQPVPLAEIEIYHIAALVNNLPEPRQAEIRNRFAKAVAHFHSKGWFEKLEYCEDDGAMKQTVLSYFREGIACPFLEEESCSIHESRPVACREFLVTSPKENCSNPNDTTVDQVPLAVNASDGVRKIGRMNDLAKKNFLPMVRALEWAEQHPENFTEKTGEEWLAEFFTA